MSNVDVNYSLYLVTDPRENLVNIVRSALEGGVTVVQLRDKASDTGDLITLARTLHEITQQCSVPLIINDRVDVALAVGCEGVHLGQGDLNIKTARKLLGASAIIGVTVSSCEEALTACKDGANYLGIGTVFATSTKPNAKCIIGTAGTRRILQAVAHFSVRTVCIGGIKSSNLQRVMYQSSCDQKSLDGVAVVSAIIAAENPLLAAKELRGLVATPPPFAPPMKSLNGGIYDVSTVLRMVPSIIKAVQEKSPLSHNMTNLVVQNFAANIALAAGASPIMSNYGLEASDLCKLGGALVINMGTVTPEGLQNYLQAILAYNLVGGPVVLDPVGAGATTIRRNAVKSLMAGGYFDLIKGNESEIKTVFGETEIQQRGVDSGISTLDKMSKAKLVRDLASRERNLVVMTGATDFVSDGDIVFVISNGHEYLGNITGSGCVLGTIISAMLAVNRTHRLAAVVTGLLYYEIAAEIAAGRQDVVGPGTFVPALMDEIFKIGRGIDRDMDWLSKAKVEVIAARNLT